MRQGKVTFFFECPACEKETEITAYEIIPARVWGPPEDCYPAEGGEFEPEECQHCGHKFDGDKVTDKASDVAQSRADDAAEHDRE
jgi:hypothetical protein